MARYEDDEEDERPRRKPKRDDDDDDEPRGRRRPDDERDDYDDDEPRRGRRTKPHRGGMILAFGILAWLFCGIFGIAAWIMGSADLKEIRAGRMDREGESLTQVGFYLGIAACILNLLAILAVVAIMILAAAHG